MGSFQGEMHDLNIGIGVVREKGWDVLENADEALLSKKCWGLVG